MNKGNNTLKKFRIIRPEKLENTEEYLGKMAEKGWMLQSIKGGNTFVFEKCEPKKVKFSVEIIYDGSYFDTCPTEKNEEYIDMCESC